MVFPKIRIIHHDIFVFKNALKITYTVPAEMFINMTLIILKK